MPDPGVLGTFAEPRAAAAAIRVLRAGGFEDVRAAMPAPYPSVVEAVGHPPSGLGWITFPGAILGLGCGVLLTVGTSLAWPLVTGGKPIVSWPPYVVIEFEVTVLIGALTNLAALLVGASRRRARAFPVRAAFHADRIGVFAAGGDPDAAERLLRASGAEEVSRVA
jgi:hypothetical protein